MTLSRASQPPTCLLNPHIHFGAQPFCSKHFPRDTPVVRTQQQQQQGDMQQGVTGLVMNWDYQSSTEKHRTINSRQRRPFVWVSVSGVVCRQAPIVLNHCSLLTQGPWHLVFPWPPGRSGRKAETGAPDLGRVCLHSPFSPLVLAARTRLLRDRAKRMAALCKCVDCGKVLVPTAQI
ncbi:unnamed protein product [Pleuronectes platessa]|uniref:Uncharacterized protein n=1 Tax=Pleuronectes platessa TaxID=8262 RepID=A0A9N7W549_PLEPL|nr:unnamed protein product [Pleuronectes platessa]